MLNVWNKQGSSYKLDEVSYQVPQLPVGVYKMEENSMFNFLYLNHISKKFDFPYKIYGTQTEFIQRVKKSWENTDGNMGVLLNGLKGTGKTVTAQQICNNMNLPVIIVSFHSKLLVSFINSINQDVIILIDEFEKIYDHYQNSLLSVMDGVLKTNYRKMFLLTTNEMNIDKNMLLRPSRIRYIKNFSDLERDVIMEIVDDTLKYPEFRADVINMISELFIITMDLVKCIIEEVNIHGEHPSTFKDVFNIHSDESDMFNVYEILDTGVRKEIKHNVRVQPNVFAPYYEGENLYIGGTYYGVVEKYISKSQLLVKVDGHDNELPIPLSALQLKTEESQEEIPAPMVKLLFFEPVSKKHRAFSNVFAY